MKELVPQPFSSLLKNAIRLTTRTGALVMLLLLFGNAKIMAEGSVDFRDYPGYRLFYWANEQQQVKVYASAGEFINVGASHIGVNGGAVVLFKPDGSLANVFDNTGANAGLGIINNDVEELNGPTGGGTTMGSGYTPGVYQVQPGEEGIWTVLITFPTPSSAITVPFINLLNNESWTKNTHQIDEWCVVAWDVTVSTGSAGNDGGALLKGRVFTNQYKSIIYQNGNTTSPKFYILAKDGFQYETDFNEVDPYGFSLFANSTGIIDFQQQPIYKSLATEDYSMSSSPATWMPGNFYLFDPQQKDFNSNITQKIFFNIPDANMPTSAQTMNLFTGEVYSTWLYNEPSSDALDITGFSFTALDDFGGNACFGANMTPGFGGDLTFNSTIGGTVTFSLDLNQDGDFDDAVDRVIYGDAVPGANTLYWDGLDGTGANIPFASNFEINYKVEMKGGEVHIMFLDIENNTGGISFKRINGTAAPDNSFYYDHTPVGGTASGGSAPNLTSTTVPYTYDSGFGNNNLLDYWAYADLTGTATGSFIVDVVASCTTPSLRDSDGDGIFDNEDIDDDNDGILDIKEYCNPSHDWSCLPNGIDPSGDNDDDGVPNYLDSNDPAVASGCTDSSGNGVCDNVPAIYDNDSDGVPDHLDLDSDNDGILDMTEAGHGLVDTDLNGRIDGTQMDFGDNGFYNPISSDPDDITAVATYAVLDTDDDDVPDYDDLDADGDGIVDAIEAPGSDPDFDGIVGTGIPVVDNNGIAILDGNGNPVVIAHAPKDLDGDGLPDYRDWDRDNDGIPDSYECPNQQDCLDSDNDGVGDLDETDSDGDGIDDATECATGTPCTDADNNGIPDYREVPTLICGTGNTPVISAIIGEGTYCVGNDVVLSASNSTTMSGVMIDYVWTGPNGVVHSGTTGSNGPFNFTLTNVTANETGTYELTLMTDQGCGSNPETVNVTVGNTSIATPTISANDDVLCEGQMLELTTPAAVGGSVSYEWFFDDGLATYTLGETNNSLFVISNTNTASTGTYTVVVTADGCSSQPSSPINIVVNSTSQPIAANTTVQSNPICEGEVVQLSVPLVQDATYEWFGPNGFTATTHDPVINNITSTGAGSYYAVVTLSDGCANLVSTNTTVYVQPTPTPATISSVAPTCEGSNVTLTANAVSLPSGANVTYEWYSVQSGNAVYSNTNPEYVINDVSMNDAGDYYVVMTVGGCVAPASIVQNVQVVSTSEMPNAGMNISECGLGNTALAATPPTLGTGTWTSPTGAVIPNANDPQAEVFGLNDGMNVLVWSLSNGVCENYATDTVVINYNLLTDVAAAGNDINECDVTFVSLNALAPSTAFAVWSQPATQTGVTISNNTSANSTVSGLVPGNTYTFTYTLSQGACLDYASDEVTVTVSELPNTLAHITEDVKYTCGDDETTLNAVAQNVGTGTWTTNSDASIITSNNASTIVADVPMGGSMFVWTLSNGACENYDADSIMVYREDAIEVTDDEFTLDLNERLENQDVMINDFVGNVNDYEVTVVEQPTLGDVVMTDGIFNYVPRENAFGTDRIVYEICNLNCLDDCQRATVTIVLNGLTETGDCWIPNVVTPNGNGKNDVLLIPCAEQFSDNELKVFNRWGDKVYATTNYQNDWAATYKGKDLPAGTYYYMFKQSKDSTPIQGFFEVMR